MSKVRCLFKYERLPNICYWCGCLNHGDRDCDLWVESEGNLTKESQAYGAWIRAAPFAKGRNFVVKVLGFYAAKKAQQKQGAKECGMNSPVKLNGDQTPTMAHAQTEAIASFQVALNERSVESETRDTLTELVRSGGQDSRESFEERLKEIDIEMGKFDKVRGGLSGDNLEREKVGIKEQKQARKADEPTPKSADRNDDNPNRHAKIVATAKSFSQSRVHEPGIKDFSQSWLHKENLETAGVNEESNISIQTHSEVLVPSTIKRSITNSNEKDLKQEEPSLIEKQAEQSLLLAQPLIFSNGPLTDTKPTVKSKNPLDPKSLKITWVRRARNTKESPSETIMQDIKDRRKLTQSEDPHPLKRQAMSNDEVLNLIPMAVAGDQPRRSP